MLPPALARAKRDLEAAAALRARLAARPPVAGGADGGKPLASFELRGHNRTAFEWRQSGELVLYGPAGSGKTVANLALMRWFCETYPGARCLMLRKTRASLTESAMVGWERDVLGPRHPCLARAIGRTHRHDYKFPNGSVVVTGGLDRADKILSTDYDLIYVNEATDLSLAEWEQVSGRTRTGSGPFDLVYGDCNPTTPTHWVYTRAARGRLTLLATSHRDNPAYWDAAKQAHTPLGERYVVGRLGAMTGARRKRFLDGEWAAAEGVVYDGYDVGLHLLPAGWQPPPDWRRYWSIDWGFRDPLVIQFWAADGDGRLYLYREFFKTETRVEVAAKWCAQLLANGEPRPVDVVADHDPENVAAFEHHSGLRLTPAQKVNKAAEIQKVQARFDVQADGKPRIFFAANARCHEADRNLEDNGRPTCTVEELASYIWKASDPERPKDEPVDRNDHGADSMLYLVRHLDSGPAVDPDFYDEPTPPVHRRVTW